MGDLSKLIPIIVLSLLAFFISYSLIFFSLSITSLIIIALILLFVSFMSPETGLYILIFSMLLSPEFIVSSFESKLTTASRGLTIRIDDIIIFLIVVSWLAKTAFYKDKESLGLLRKTSLNKPVVAFILICIYSTGLGVMSGTTTGLLSFFYVLKYIEFFVVYFVAANYLHTEKQVRNYTIAIISTAVIVSIVSISQVAFLGAARLSAPFEGKSGEPNTFGGYLVLILSVIVGIYLNIKDKKMKAILLGVGSFLFITFLFTLSRSSYLAFVVMYIGFLVINKKRGVLLLVILVLLAAAPFLAPQSVKDRIMYTFRPPKESGQYQIGEVHLDTSTSARIESWRYALQTWYKHPFFGVGVAGITFADAQYVRVLTETGAIGLGIFLYFLYTIFMEALRAYRNTHNLLHKGFAQGMVVATVALMAHAIGTNTFYIVRIMEPYYFLLAITMLLPHLEKPQAGTVKSSDQKQPHTINNLSRISALR